MELSVRPLLMVEDSAEVRDAMAGAAAGLMTDDEARAVHDKVGSEISTKGQMWGYIGGTACIIGTFVVYIALGVAGVSTNWALGICTALSGVWWFVTSWFAFARWGGAD